jgi:signal recognition particle subunit SEC65
MSCYFRHLKEILDQAGIEVTGENKKDIDRAIHKVMDTEYKNCPDTWKKVKEIINNDNDTGKNKFMEKIKAELNINE